ncbi:MAG TPA: hypothetical protein VNA67_04105 [Pseudonocardiaceae bacterium]|nr:hypothetical protein [Pseudonocardiaceae bacterium]
MIFAHHAYLDTWGGVTRQALALFLVAPQVLYAVNREVNFVPYATSFELADTSVSSGHWSVR